MTAISNFTQAMKELTGFEDDPANNDRAEKKEPTKSWKAPENTDLNHKDGSLITGTMAIKGDISGTDEMRINGKISGNLNITAAAYVSGNIVGNIEADSLFLKGAVKGDIKTASDIGIEPEAVVVGNVFSKNAAVRGRLKGNMQIKELTILSHTALVAGDISTGSLSSENGCIISGRVKTKDTNQFKFNEKKLFDIFDTEEK